MKELKIEKFYTSRPDLWIDFHLLAMKYKNMNILQRLIFRIKAKICKPKITLDKILLTDTTVILENLKRDNSSYNELLKKEFKNED